MGYGLLYLTGETNTAPVEALFSAFMEASVLFIPLAGFYILGLVVQKDFFEKELVNRTEVEFKLTDWMMALINGAVLFMVTASAVWIISMLFGEESFTSDIGFFERNLVAITLLPWLFFAVRLIRYGVVSDAKDAPVTIGDDEAEWLKGKLEPFEPFMNSIGKEAEIDE